MIRSLLLVVPLAALAACKTTSPNYVAGDGSNGPACGSDGECKMAGLPACEMSTGTCEPCTAMNLGVCMGTTPRCENNACVACVDDVTDCKGGVCLPTGDCADASRIIYASGVSTKLADCGDATTPCSLNTALGMVTPTLNVVKLVDQNKAPFASANGFTVSSDVTIDARGATLNRPSDGPILTVMGGKTLTLLGGTIQGTVGTDGDGISCTGSGSALVAIDTKVENNAQSGINADTCTLTLTRVTVNNNSQKMGAFAPGINVSKGSIALTQSRIDSNNGGGLSITNAVFQIVGNVFSNNGPPGAPDPQSPVGGVSLSAPGNPANRLDFNTIAGNHAQAGGPGLQCTAGNLAVRNNIIYNNNDNTMPQFGGNCQPMYSDLGFPTTDINNNTHVDPMFGTSFHLSASSPLLGKADPNSDLTGIASQDIDGEPRVKRSGMGADIGADQYYPPNP